MNADKPYRNEYPINLLIDGYKQAGIPFAPESCSMTEEQKKRLEKAPFSLSARLQKFLRLRYEEFQFCKASAESEGMAEARVRTSLRRLLKNLSSSDNMELIQKGMPEVLREKEEAMNQMIADPRAKEISLDDLQLSVRTYNALKRAGIFTVKEILIAEKEGRLSEIRLLGEKGRIEILADAGSALKQKGGISS